MSELYRPADLGGTWYPGTDGACAQFLDSAKRSPKQIDMAPVGVIVPHAGWVYSGAIAYDALTRLAKARPNPDLVIVFGGHLGPMHEPRLLIQGGWQTPFGPTKTPEELAQDVAMSFSCDLETPEEYYEDNAIEVQMPMIKRLWPDAEVLTLGVPPTEDAPPIGTEVVRCAKARRYNDIVIVGSTDLTHYGPNYDFRPHGSGFAALEWVRSENDPEVIRAIEAMKAAEVLWIAKRRSNACCPGAIAAAMTASMTLGAQSGQLVEHTTSFDVHPTGTTPTSFVGYAGIVLGKN